MILAYRATCHGVNSGDGGTFCDLPVDVLVNIVSFAINETAVSIAHSEHLIDCAVNKLLVLNKDYYVAFKAILESTYARRVTPGLAPVPVLVPFAPPGAPGIVSVPIPPAPAGSDGVAEVPPPITDDGIPSSPVSGSGSFSSRNPSLPTRHGREV